MVAALAVAVVCARPASAVDTDLDVQYAEHLPLVAESLLLDIMKIPGYGYVAVGERGHVVLSKGGDAWRQAEVVPTRSTLTTVAQAEGRLWAGGHDTVIITSGDHGETWTLQYFDPERQQPIMDLYFFDEQRGLAIGAYDLYLVTEDGGKTWDDALVNEEEWHNNAVVDLGGGRLMIAGEAGFTYRSEDHGDTWETIEMPYGGSMFGIVRSVSDCLLVFGLRGHVQESCDFGDSWAEIDSGTELTIAGGIFREDSVWLVGNSGLVMTRKGRGPFQVYQHSSGVDFAKIVPLEGDRFLLVGEDGVHMYPEAAEASDD